MNQGGGAGSRFPPNKRKIRVNIGARILASSTDRETDPIKMPKPVIMNVSCQISLKRGYILTDSNND
jgi:hypothetical protein